MTASCMKVLSAANRLGSGELENYDALVLMTLPSDQFPTLNTCNLASSCQMSNHSGFISLYAQ